MSKEQEYPEKNNLFLGVAWYFLCAATIVGVMAVGSDCGGIVYCYGDSRDLWWHPSKLIASLIFAILLPLPHILLALFSKKNRSAGAVARIARRWHKWVALTFCALFVLHFFTLQFDKTFEQKIGGIDEVDGKGSESSIPSEGEAVATPTLEETSSSEKWVLVEETDERLWSGKKGSLVFLKLRSKTDDAVGYIVELTEKISGNRTYRRAVVELSACANGYGYFYQYNMEGELVQTDPFFRYGDFAPSALADIACRTAENTEGRIIPKSRNMASVLVAKSEDMAAEVYLAGSVLRSRHKEVPAFSGLMWIAHKDLSRPDYSEYFVSQSDCNQGSGMLYQYDFDRSLKYSNDFVVDGRSLISITATAICSLGKKFLEQEMSGASRQIY